MRIVDRSVYVGPSLYAHFPVIRMDVDLGELEAWPTVRLGAGFIDGLLDALPGLREHGCSYGEAGGFIRRMTEEEGTWLGHVLEHVAIELQCAAGEKVTFGKTRGFGDPGHYHVVYEYEQEEVGLEAGSVALRLIQSLLPESLRPSAVRDFDWPAERVAFIRFAQRRDLGPSTAALVHAAEARGIPWIRLNQQSLIQFGHGKHQQRIQATITGRTSHIAVELASDKEETNRILSSLGLPVPRQRLVTGEDDAVRQAERVGYPVVVKPYNANHGRGVSIGLTRSEEVRTAFHSAQQHSRSVIIESFIRGDDHRMLVVQGRLIAVSRREPGHVVGDGEHTISQLIDLTNQDPRRGIGHEKVLTRIELDGQAERLLAAKGWTAATVPAAGERVYLRSTGNLSTGGTATDVTDVVHPDNVEMATRAVQAIGLDVGGVDFLTTDVTESFKDTGGAICEVNAAPGFRMHMAPSEGRARDVAGPVIDMLFPPGTTGRIPIAALTGTNGKTTTVRMVAHILKMAGQVVGLTTTDGVYVNGQRTVEGDMTGPVATRMVLMDPLVDTAVLEVARGGLLRAGMGARWCDVGAVLNVQADHLGLRGVETLDELAKVKRVVVEVARDTAVLNADDPLCLRMADYTEAKHICYVTMDPGHPLVRQHITAGGRGVVLETGMKGQMITLYDHGAHIPLLWTHLIPATLEGRATHNVQNAMFASAIAFSMGTRLEDIRTGLRTFDTTFFQAPGRMNVFDEHPFKVILDYGHNPPAVRQMAELVSRLDVAGRRIVVLAAPGDRRDEDVVDIARAAAGRFDHYVVRRDDQLRGRGPDEIPAMLRAALLEAGVPESAIEVIPDEREATAHALGLAAAGDLLLVFADALTRTWKQIVGWSSGAAPARPAQAPAATASAASRAAAPAAANAGADGGRSPLTRPPATVFPTTRRAVSDDAELELVVQDERGVRLQRELDD
ncbi:MAG: cyanophycin synthetase [Gemmatimonadales bacterium]